MLSVGKGINQLESSYDVFGKVTKYNHFGNLFDLTF